jgi:hypothetical protein
MGMIPAPIQSPCVGKRIDIMDMIKNGWGRISAALAVAVTLVIGGCGDDSGLDKRFPISGNVKVNGAPLEKGTITFNPTTPEGRAATGSIENGRYSLTTVTPNDGALPGSYKVTVVAKEIQEADAAKIKEIAKGGQAHHDATFAKANKNAKSLVPSKYSLADTSGLTADVKAASSSTDFDLK